MKPAKHISIILTLLILFSNIGLALNVHYCHDMVSGISLTYKADHCEKKAMPKSCCAMASKADKKCCKSHVVKLQDKTDQVLVKSLTLDLGVFYPVAVWNPLQALHTGAPLTIKENPSFYCDSHAPPLFKLYCQYIFYA
ncbi:hypothetical protein Q765_05795 [Flavobacterium rivuli WB 3.3-2 = DSM 21788]|uniref:Uncharacterized protein n=1 Tax=Flavobacterium rivuli WB 3.3-2 = DSM 21788 TaxID=1121895 RepID=A0A0A2M4T5_9FLAO|nr:hypothetical protein [Flavobacterium rivuli]KGO87642.1 hypothetical protein Q765_05795 [Flavobacterium rivuli WB 3.3-2 = DSM 21788]